MNLDGGPKNSLGPLLTTSPKMHQRRLVRPLLYHFQGYQMVCWALELGAEGFPRIHLEPGPAPKHCPPQGAARLCSAAGPHPPSPARPRPPGFRQAPFPASLWAASASTHVGAPSAGFSRIAS